MRILFLSPQPFFQERGTPIAVRLALEELAKRASDRIDLLTYHEGKDVPIPNVTHRRIRAPRWIRNIGPGISLRKLLCDVYFLVDALKLVRENRSSQYNLIHAVEESVFVAWLIKLLYGVPYIYDMDSSLAMQVVEKWFWLKPLSPLFEWLEKLAVRSSAAVVPVCDALATIAARHGSRSTTVLSDISLLDMNQPALEPGALKKELCLPDESLIALYIGNLEKYQGIDLLLESFASISPQAPSAHLVIIGGHKKHIQLYQEKADWLGVAAKTHFTGPRPVASLNHYLTQADILVSPRTKGNNTPMKIYSYLHSGIPIVATLLFTHTQVLTPEVAKLALPTPKAYGHALLELLQNADERARVGNAARALAQSRYTLECFQRTLNAIYDSVSESIAQR